MKNLYPNWMTNETNLPTEFYGIDNKDFLIGTFGTLDKDNNNLNFQNKEPWYALKQNYPKISFLSLKQIHSNLIHEVGKPLGKFINLGEGDGLTTKEPGLALTIRTADCMPIWIKDDSRISLLHVGYKGLANCIIDKAMTYHCNYNIEVFIGSHIKACCLEVKADILKLFDNYPYNIDNAIIKRGDKTYLDMLQIVKESFLNYAIKDIKLISDQCTFCDNSQYSYRKQGPKALHLGHLAMRKWPST